MAPSSPPPAGHQPPKKPQQGPWLKLAAVCLAGGAVAVSGAAIYNGFDDCLGRKRPLVARGQAGYAGNPLMPAGLPDRAPELDITVEHVKMPPLSPGPGQHDWPCFLGPSHDGTSAESGLSQGWPGAGPPLIWERTVGKGYSAPSVAHGCLVLYHRIDTNDVIECLDAATGETFWKATYQSTYRDSYGYSNGPRCTPIITDDRVYVLGAQGQFACLALDTGRVIWKRSINAEFNVPRSFFGLGASPLLEGDLLLLNVGGPDGAGIVAFHKDKGDVVWKATDYGQSYSSPICATVDNERHAFFLTKSGLVSIAPDNGAQRWYYPFRARAASSVNAATPVVVGDLVFISASYQVGAALLRVTPEAREEVWRDANAMSNHWATSIHHQGRLYGIDGRHTQESVLRCIDLKTGTKQWDYTQEGLGRASMIMADGRFIILGEKGLLLLVPVSADACKVTARAQLLDGICFTGPILARGRLYLRNEKKLLCLDLRSPQYATGFDTGLSSPRQMFLPRP